MTSPSTSAGGPVCGRALELARVVTGTTYTADDRDLQRRVLALGDQFGEEAVASWLEGLIADGWRTLSPRDLTRLAGRGVPTVEAAGAA